MFKRYGLPVKDDRVPVTIKLLCDIAHQVNKETTNEVCMMAASTIGFFGCLRCGEFTVARGNAKNFIRVRDLKIRKIEWRFFLPKVKPTSLDVVTTSDLRD